MPIAAIIESERTKNTAEIDITAAVYPRKEAISDISFPSGPSPKIPEHTDKSSRNSLCIRSLITGSAAKRHTVTAPMTPVAALMVPTPPAIVESASLTALPTTGIKLPTANLIPLSARLSALFEIIP